MANDSVDHKDGIREVVIYRVLSKALELGGFMVGDVRSNIYARDLLGGIESDLKSPSKMQLAMAIMFHEGCFFFGNKQAPSGEFIFFWKDEGSRKAVQNYLRRIGFMIRMIATPVGR